jgi:hypothetical protein
MTDKPTCAGPECDRPVWAKGFCNTHCTQFNRGKPLTPIRKWGKYRVCDFEGCGRGHFGQGLCRTHYAQWTRTDTVWPIGERAEQ